MNLTFHIIRKDLRTLRWGLLLWVAACLTHLELRLTQLARGDFAAMTPFWIRLERSMRWDYLLVCALPVLLIPVLLQLDPLRGRLSFWKTLPINRWRLLAAKMCTLLSFFVLLPLACEAVYFTSAQLTSVLPQALIDWAWRFLPGIAAVTLGCIFARSLIISIPGVALALWVAVSLWHWPMGPTVEKPTHMAHNTKQPAPVPVGIKASVDPKTVKLGWSARLLPSEPGKPKRSEERLAVEARVAIEALPSDIMVKDVSLRLSRFELAGHNVAPDSEENASKTGTPALYRFRQQQEQLEGFGRGDFEGMHMLPGWYVSSGDVRFVAEDLPKAGVPVEGTVHIRFARRVPVATLPLVEGAAWQGGLHRLTISQVSPPESIQPQLMATLTTTLADPFGKSGGSAFRRGSYFLLVGHRTLPYRKSLLYIAPDAWAKTSLFASQLPQWNSSLAHEGWSGAVTDITRSRKRTVSVAGFNPEDLLRKKAQPIARARFLEEQAQTRNWRLSLERYDDAGAIDIPIKTVIARPDQLLDEREPELGPLLPALGSALAEIKIPAAPTREEAKADFVKICDLVKVQKGDVLRKNENVLLQKLAALGPDNIEVLLAAATTALGRTDQNAWEFLEERGNSGHFFWLGVLRVAGDLARPVDQALFLKYCSPAVDLLPVIEAMGWSEEALPAMRRTALHEAVPESWQDVLANGPGENSKEVLYAQIRLGAMSAKRVSNFIERGILPGRKAASVLWETAVMRKEMLGSLVPSFSIAAANGVEIIPRDLQRILRLTPGQVEGYSAGGLRMEQMTFMQAFSLRSDCPPTLSAGASWLTQNALQLTFNETTGRYELPGSAAPVPNISAWGKFVDPLRSAKLALADGAVTMTSAALRNLVPWATPRLEREFAGDFTYEVVVSPAFNLAPTLNSKDVPSQAAGVQIQMDENRYLRWEQGLLQNTDGHQLREEVERGGNLAIFQRRNEPWDPAKPTRFRVSRCGTVYQTAWKQADGAWHEADRRDLSSWIGKVRASCIIVNNTVRPFSARFSDLRAEEGATPPLVPLAYPAVPKGMVATPSGTALGEWGIWQNPVNSGVAMLEGDTLSITVAPEGGDYSITQRMDAPRVLREMEDDFRLEATITPTGKINRTGAEILLLADSENFVRIGLVVGPEDKPQLTCDRADGGRPSEMIDLRAPRDLSKPLRIRLQRQGRLLTISQQQKGGEWTTFYPLNIGDWPAKIQAGVVALNTSKEPFTAVFSDFLLKRESAPKP